MSPLILHHHPDLVSRHLPGFRVENPLKIDSDQAAVISYFPYWSQGVLPDLEAARVFLARLGHASGTRVQLISSALALGSHFRNPGLMSESRFVPTRRHTAITRAWNRLEQLFRDHLPEEAFCTLRIPPCPLLEPDSLFGQLLEERLIPGLRLFDPPLQFLHPEDLGNAIRLAAVKQAKGTFHLAPKSILRSHLLRQRQGWRQGLPAVDESLRAAVQDLFRYPWTLSDDKARSSLGYNPAFDSFEAMGLTAAGPEEGKRLDPFGMDPDYIQTICGGLAGFIHRRYFRIEYQGEEHLPDNGRLVLLGLHRGFMPIDALMLLTHFVNDRNSHVRVPIHHTLLKTPLPFKFAALGGFPAYAENMDRIIQSNQWLLVFPEGVNGAFKLYSEAYEVSSHGFAETVACAIRNQTPIVPVLTIGSAEIFIVLKKLNWGWFQKKTSWPCLPIAPPFPLLPFPLPTKWRTRFLAPVHLEQKYDPADAEDTTITRRVGEEIRQQMQEEWLRMKAQRTSLWR